MDLSPIHVVPRRRVLTVTGQQAARCPACNRNGRQSLAVIAAFRIAGQLVEQGASRCRGRLGVVREAEKWRMISDVVPGRA
jgi:hypothetical protein